MASPFNTPLVPAKAGTQARPDYVQDLFGIVSPEFDRALATASCLGPGLRRDERD
jgi:hypothetical protein